MVIYQLVSPDLLLFLGSHYVAQANLELALLSQPLSAEFTNALCVLPGWLNVFLYLIYPVFTAPHQTLWSIVY